MPGKFIVFEGLDGSGLTTQATILRNYLEKKGKRTVLTKEPTDGLIGGLIKACLRREWKTDPETLQMLFAADRAHHLKTLILPTLKTGKNVICDRYILSSMAFGAIDVSLKNLKQLNENFAVPNMTFVIDTQPKICIERIQKARPHVEIFEEEGKLQQIRKNYQCLKNHYNDIYFIDGNREPELVFADIEKIIKNTILAVY
jgi:dTMP kinase